MTAEEKLKEEIARDYLFPWVHSTGAKWDKMTDTVRLGYYKRAEALLKHIRKDRPNS